MIIIAENINATRKAIAAAIKSRDEAYITSLAQQLAAAGAGFIDVNAGSGHSTRGEKAAAMQWLVQTVQQAVATPLVIDSDESEVIAAALEVYKGEKVLINSVTAEPDKLKTIGAMAAAHKAGVVALAMGESGIPQTAQERIGYCRTIMEELVKLGLEPSDIYFDPLVIPVSVDQEQARVTLQTITSIKDGFEGARTVMGLSNISYGLPARRLINRTFLAMAAYAGLDAAILDPLDARIVSASRAADVLTGSDRFCRRYSRAHRQQILE